LNTGNESDSSADSKTSPANEEFYTAGWSGLKDERIKIAQYSLKRYEALTLISDQSLIFSSLRNRSRERTDTQRKTLQVNPSHIKASRKLLYNSLKTNGLAATQVGGSRPVASCSFNPVSVQLATGSWDGNIKLWEVPSCTQIADLVGNTVTNIFIPYKILITGLGHQDKVTSVEWDHKGQLLISAGGDGVIYGWSAAGERMAEYTGHQIRCNRLGWHPSGEYFGSTR
jgi:U4/U6 small nuclear ribonucleoprotein PRP4